MFLKIFNGIARGVDPDQTALLSDLGLQCLRMPFCQKPWKIYGPDKADFKSGVVLISSGLNSSIVLYFLLTLFFFK